MNINNAVNATSQALGSTLNRLSSGTKRVADDPAGAAIAENLGTRADSQAAARRATSDGIGVAQVASGASSQVGDLLTRMRELAVGASSGVVGGTARTAFQEEFAGLQDEIDRISQATEFNGMSLTDGSRSSLSVQAGVDGGSDSQIQLSLGDLRATSLGVDVSSMDLSSASGAQGALAGLDSAIDTVNQYQSDYGGGVQRLSSAFRGSETSSIALSSAASQISDVDYAQESAKLAAQDLKNSVAIAAQAQGDKLGQSAVQLLGG